MSKLSFHLLILICCAIPLPGCGQSEAPVEPIHGQVRYRGQPVRGGIIAFIPDPDRGTRGELALCDIDRNGRFVLNAEDDPAPSPGWYRISVSCSDHFQLLPIRYRDPAQSGLVCRLPPEADAGLTVELQ